MQQEISHLNPLYNCEVGYMTGMTVPMVGETISGWEPTSWKSRPIKQEVIYEDKAAFHKAVLELRRLPPIVTPYEINNLKNELRDVAQGKAFLLQGGDCAELFDYCNQDMIESKVKLLLQMSLVLTHGARKKIVRVARMAGQYAKPRSQPTEMVNGTEMPSFRGDILNSFEADLQARQPNPERLVKAYHYSAATLNYLRAALKAGLADLHAPLIWNLGHVRDPELRQKYQDIVEKISDFLDMARSIGVETGSGFREADIYSSHEGLLLEYESGLTRLCNHPTTYDANNAAGTRTDLPRQSKGYYNTSAHFLWIGDRTRQLDHAHTEYFRGICNPIGVKIGPSMPPEDIVPLLDILNPTHEVGKVVLITRYGAEKVAKHLPGHIKAVQASPHDRTVVWQCDPMHGNGRNAEVSLPHVTNSQGLASADATSQEQEEQSSQRSAEQTEQSAATAKTTGFSTTTYKTRRFSDIVSELKQALEIHKANNSYLGGIHLELTGEPVTECVGGAEGLTEQDLSLNYTTFCDPRLNEKQALELAFLVAGFYRDSSGVNSS